VLSAHGPTTGDGGDGVDRSDANQAVHDPARRVRRAEVLAEHPGDEVELGDRDKASIEPTDDQQGPGE
jgi:hypothetical protein